MRHNEITPHHFIGGVVGALDQNIGAQLLNQFARRILGEQDHRIDAREGCDNQSARMFGLDRPTFALEPLHRGVIIECDNQPVTGRTCLFDQGNMSRMHQIEAAIGETYLQAARTPLRHPVYQRLATEKL